MSSLTIQPLPQLVDCTLYSRNTQQVFNIFGVVTSAVVHVPYWMLGLSGRSPPASVSETKLTFLWRIRIDVAPWCYKWIGYLLTVLIWRWNIRSKDTFSSVLYTLCFHCRLCYPFWFWYQWISEYICMYKKMEYEDTQFSLFKWHIYFLLLYTTAAVVYVSIDCSAVPFPVCQGDW